MRRPKIRDYTDAKKRITVTVPFLLTRKDTWDIFEELDGLYGYSGDGKPATLPNAMNYLREHLSSNGWGSPNDVQEGTDVDEEWVEAMTAAIWGE